MCLYRGGKLPHTYVQFQKLFAKAGAPPQCIDAPDADMIPQDTSTVADDEYTVPDLTDMGYEALAGERIDRVYSNFYHSVILIKRMQALIQRS